MLKIFDLHLELIRRRFKIFGIFNILTLLSTLIILIISIKIVQHFIGHYEKLSLILTATSYTLFSRYIFPSSISQYNYKYKTYFTDICSVKLNIYSTYKNLILFFIGILYLLIPTKISDLRMFIFNITIINIFIFIKILCKKIFSNEKFLTISQFINMCIIVFMLLYTRNFISLSFNNLLTDTTILILLIISIILIYNILKNINFENKNINSIYFIKFSNTLLTKFENKDIVYAIRKNILIEPLLIIIVSNLFFYEVTLSRIDKLYTCTFSILTAIFSIYINILKMENGKFNIFYNLTSIKIFKKEKIRNTLILSIIILSLSSIFLIFIISYKIILLSCIISLSIGISTISLLKITLEKVTNTKNIIKNSDTIKIYILSFIAIFLIITAITKINKILP